MKLIIKKPTEIEIDSVRICVAVRYDDEDMPNDFPLRRGDIWDATVKIDTGEIAGWPKGKTAEIYMKICDEGKYQLLDASGKMIAERVNEYVPHGVVPGKYGDYINLVINADGIITNWPKHPDVDVFFE